MARKSQTEFLETAAKEGLSTFTRPQLIEFCEKHGLKYPFWLVNNRANVISRGLYRLPIPETKFTLEEPIVTQSGTDLAGKITVPEIDPLFVPYGHYADIKTILESRQFQPFTITGPTGTGKTKLIQQVCAQLQRPMVRMNMTSSTDEDMIIGGFRLVDGETQFFKGPAIIAMEQGAVLLIDEFDLGDPEKIMCLQPIAEGSGYFIKQTGEYVAPRPGFTIAATANTKGQGSSTGEYIGTQILNEAFLERFDNTFDQDYPPARIEKNILALSLGHHCKRKPTNEDIGFISNLVQWAANIRKGYAEGSQAHSMSTRRLVQITKTFALFNDKMKAIELCVNRFDHFTKNAFIQFYEKIDAEAEASRSASTEELKDKNAKSTSTAASTSNDADDLPWGN